MKGIIYLAGPYSHPDPAVRVERFNALNGAAADLIAQGNIVYSPISHTHPVDVVLKERGVTHLESSFWCNFDEAFMEHCSEIIVLKIDGWDRSSGVAREVEFFTSRGLPVRYMEPSS